VPPNIDRRRTLHEPREAAWETAWYCSAPAHDETCFQQDCKLVKRQRYPRHSSEQPGEESAEVFEDVIPSGIDPSGATISPESYVAAWSSCDAEAGKETFARIREETYNEDTAAYLQWHESKTGSAARLTGDDTETDTYYEHITGPHCIASCGYNGNTISAGEMRYCNTVQFFAHYNDGRHVWPEADGEDFERKGKYHLTGLADRCLRSFDYCNVHPERHGCPEVCPSALGGFYDGNPLFHPYCPETYRRVLTLRIQEADLSDVAEWISRRDNDRPSSYHDSAPPRHPAMYRADYELWWLHNAGDEFLVADPLHVSGLSALFEAAKRPQLDSDAHSSPFGEELEMPATPGDPFGKLPKELRDMVLEDLGSKDIASLRVASRSFRDLPNTLWHDLMKKEMPWIWEAWTDRPYPFMSRTTENEVIAHSESIDGLVQAAEALSPGSEQREVLEQRIARRDTKFRKPHPVEQLDRLRTDWHYLYCQLQREWKNIKGLQNRERICKAAEFVVRRIAMPDEDLSVAEHEHAKAFPYQDLYSVKKAFKHDEEELTPDKEDSNPDEDLNPSDRFLPSRYDSDDWTATA
jgi:hypothetical protein